MELREKVILLLLIAILSFSITPQEQAKLILGKAVEEWVKGNFESAMNLVGEALDMPVDPFDLPKLYYIRSRIKVDLSDVKGAFDDLRSILAVSMGTREVVEQLREMEYLTGEREIEWNLRVEKLFEIKGIIDGIEYFYTLDDLAVWNSTIYAVDRINSRLLVYDHSILVRTYELSFRPLSVEVSPSGDVFLSGEDGNIYRISKGRVEKLFSGMRSPLLAGFDRSGFLWGLDGLRAFRTDGENLEVFELNLSMVPIDCEVNGEGFWVLDALNRRLVVFSKEDLRVKKMIALPIEVKSFELTPFGSAFLLSNEGKIYYFKNFKELVELDVGAPGAMNLEYSYPVLLFSDWIDNRMEVLLASEGEPLIVKIVSLEKKGGDLEISFRVEGFSGDEVNFAGDMVFVEIDGGRLKPEVSMDLVKEEAYRSSADFLTDRLVDVRSREGIKVLVPSISYHSDYDLVTLRSKGVRLFVSERGPEKLERISRLSGGEVSGEILPGWRRIWKAKVSYTPDVATRVHTLRFGVEFMGKLYSDTVYVVDKGVVGGEGE